MPCCVFPTSLLVLLVPLLPAVPEIFPAFEFFNGWRKQTLLRASRQQLPLNITKESGEDWIQGQEWIGSQA